jgi:hypothetical protein
MTDEALCQLIPQHKHDTERAEQVVALGYPAAAPILPELIKWLQDYNWPVAHVLAPFLESIGLPLVPEIRRVLATDDDCWKYYLLTSLVNTRELVAALRADLTRLVEQPTAREVVAELPEVAAERLAQYG